MEVYNSAADIQFVYWNQEGAPGDNETSWESVLRQADSPQVFIDGKNTTADQKESQDEFYQSVLDGDFELRQDHILVDGESYGDSDERAALRPIAENRDSIHSIDSGPVLESDKLEGYNPFTIIREDGEDVSQLPENSADKPQNGFDMAGRVMHIDGEYCSHIKSQYDSERDTIVLRGAATQLPYELSEEFSVHKANIPVRTDDIEMAVSLARTPR
jgi:hypothetical protein